MLLVYAEYKIQKEPEGICLLLGLESKLFYKFNKMILMHFKNQILFSQNYMKTVISFSLSK